MRKVQPKEKFLKHCHGFTLIELMLTMALGLLVASAVAIISFTQTTYSLQRLDELEAQRNAMVAIDTLKQILLKTRYSMTGSVAMQGTVAVGRCYNDANPVVSQGSCNNLPQNFGADRLRLVYLVPDNELVQNLPYGNAVACQQGVASPFTISDLSKIEVVQTVTNTMTAGTIAALSGACADGSGYASDILQLTSDGGSYFNCNHTYAFTLLEGGPVTTCSSGYGPFFSFGRAQIVDFYLQQDSYNPNINNLMIKVDPTLPLSQGYVAAYGVEDMQVTYYIDTSATADGYWDTTADDPRIPADGGNGPTVNDQGDALTSNENYNRIVAIEVVLRITTQVPRTSNLPSVLDANALLQNPIANSYDHYKRWIYRVFVGLRNTNL